jgi:hypothetical protein
VLIKRLALAVITSLAFSLAAIPAAQAHAITCSWDKYPGTPRYNSGGGISGTVRVYCTDRLDDANTMSQLQYRPSWGWDEWGVGVVSYATGPTITVIDTAPRPNARYNFRTQGTHFGQHGNMWALPTWYSTVVQLG